MGSDKRFNSLKEFYPFYLQEHQNKTCRRLHFVGTGLTLISLLLFFLSFLTQVKWIFMITAPLLGYGFAWVGHFFFEKNKPATFQHPFYSLASDFILFFEILWGKRPL